jgi:hypothetical protein
VEPPEELERRLEATLGELVELAAEELEGWELTAMKDPRNWPRAVGGAAAVVVGAGAAVGLVVLRTQRRRRRRPGGGLLDAAGHAAREALRVFEDVRPH